MQGWLRIGQAAEFCGVSKRTLRSWLKSDLRHIRRGGIVLIKTDWIDEFLEQFEVDQSREVDINSVVDEIVGEMM